jgi:hypothetical protein
MFSLECVKGLLISLMFSAAVFSRSGNIKKVKSSQVFNIQMNQIQHIEFREGFLPIKCTRKSFKKHTRKSQGRHLKGFKLNDFHKNSVNDIYRTKFILRPPVQFLVNGKPLNTKWKRKPKIRQNMNIQ